MKTNSTITDKKKFSCEVVDKPRYMNLSQEQKVLFDGIRNSMLEIFPTESGYTYDNETIRYAENFAFISLDALEKYINKKLEDLSHGISEKITEKIMEELSKTKAAQPVKI